MSQSLEIARFRIESEAEQGLLAAWPSMVDAMKRAHPALESVRLVKFDDGTWADIAVWSRREAADEACGLAPLPEVEAFFAHIAEDLSMDVTTVFGER